MASQFSTNTAANQEKERQVAQRLQQDYRNQRRAKQQLINPTEKVLDDLAKTASPTGNTQRNVQPLLPGQSLNESMNPGNRTQKRGVVTTADGTVMPSSEIMRIYNQGRTARDEINSPINRAGSVAEGLTSQDYNDMTYAQEKAVPEFAASGLAPPQSRQQMGFNQGINVSVQDDFSNRNNIVDLLMTDDTRSYARQLGQDFPLTRESLLGSIDPTAIARKADNIKSWSEQFKKAFDKLFAGEMNLKNPTDIEAIQSMLIRNNISPKSLTELLYNNIAPASQLMDGNSPMGLSGAMILAVLQNAAEAKVAQDRTIKDLNHTPKTQADLDSWSKEDKNTYRNLENEMYNEAMGGVKSIGHLIAEAGQMKMTGDEMALLSEIAKKVAVDTFGEQMFVKLPSVMGERIQLTDNMTAWVNEDKNMMAHLLNQPLKLPRVGLDGEIAWVDAKTDFRAKGIPDAFNAWMENKDITSEHFEELHKRALNVLNNTPHTTLVAQSRGLGLMMGFNSQTGEFSNNVLTEMFDHPEFKDIQYGGVVGNRTLNVSKYDIVNDEMREMRDFSDTEKDNIVNLNIKAAIEYIGQQIRFDHFVGNNYRFYHEAQVLSPTNHIARSLLGAGSFIPYEINNQKDMMNLKAGIMTMVGLKVPGSKMKLSQSYFDVRADAFDANIEQWVYKYGDIVQDMSMLDGSVESAGLEMDLVKELKDPNAQSTQAMKDLLEYAQGLDGYYTVNAVIEAVKLQQAINKGEAVYNSNYMFEVDGTSNGLAINALLTAEREILAMTGVTEYLLTQDSGYTYPAQYDDKGNLIPQTDTSGINMLTAPKPPEELTQAIISMLEMQASPGKRNLLRVGVDTGLISDGASKNTMTPAMYGAGFREAKKLVGEAYIELLTKDASIEKELLDPYKGGYSSRDEVIEVLAGLNWSGLTAITGNLRRFNGLHTKFMDRIIEQYADSEQKVMVDGKMVGTGIFDLPPPVTILDSGYIMRHGEPVQTIHGSELALPYNLPGSTSGSMRQMTNMIDPLGRKRNPKTGELYDYNGALTGAAVKMTHHVDAHMVFQMMLRMYAENPGAAHGVTGGILLQMYDGFFGAPKYAEYMDRTLNEEFVNLGYRINNIKAMIDTAEKQGYEINTMEMRNIRADMNTEMARGQNLLKQAYGPEGGLAINQFQIMDGRVVKEPKLKDNKIFEFNFDDFTQRMDETKRGAKDRHIGGKFVGPMKNTKIWNREPGETEAEAKQNTIDKQKSLENRKRIKIKLGDTKRTTQYNNTKAVFKVSDKVMVSAIRKRDAEGKSYNKQIIPGKGTVSSYMNDKFGNFKGYIILMEDGSKQEVEQDNLRKDFTDNRGFDSPF